MDDVAAALREEGDALVKRYVGKDDTVIVVPLDCRCIVAENLMARTQDQRQDGGDGGQEFCLKFWHFRPHSTKGSLDSPALVIPRGAWH